MTWKHMWSIKEAAMAADILDEVGQFDKAELLDQYIEAIGNNDIIAQAGLWSKFKGWAKTKLFSEYRELVSRAREAQEALEKQIDDLDEKFSNARKNLKNYNLNEWRLNLQNIQQQAVDINKLVSQYDASYGRFLKAVIGVEKLAPEEMTKGLSPSEQVEKIFETASGTEQSQIANVVKNNIKYMMEQPTWEALDTKNNWYEKNTISGEIRVKNDKLNQLKKHIKPVQLDNGDIAHTINREAKGKRPPWLENFMGNKLWKPSHHDDEWFYFKAVEPSSKPDLKETEVEEKTPEMAPGEAYSAEPKLQDVPPNVFEGKMPTETFQRITDEDIIDEDITDEDIVGEEELPKEEVPNDIETTPAPASTPSETKKKKQEKDRRFMKKWEAGQIPMRPKGGGTTRWRSPSKFNKDEFDFAPMAIVKSKDGDTKPIPQELYEQNKDKYELVRLITEENTMGERIARLMELLIKEG